MADYDPPIDPPTCEHQWVHRGVQGLAISWLVTCTQCGAPNVEDMNRQIRDMRQPVRAWARRLRFHAGVTSWPFALKFAARRMMGRGAS